MPFNSLTGSRFSMRAEVLKQGQVVPDPIDIDKYGQWVRNQDPLTNEIVRIWVPYPTPIDPDIPDITAGTIDCLVRGIVDGGVQVSGTTERFGDTYQNLEYIKMWTPPKVNLTKNDRVTNIRNRAGQIMWLDEEFEGVPKATVFNVNGVTPLFDPFNRHIENFVLLERAEVANA